MSRIHPFQQIEATDCGITCIRILAKYYGKDVPLQALREICNINRLGISIKNLISGMDEIGLFAKCVRLTIYDLREAPLPVILFWNQNHFVVLYKIKGGNFYIVDPAVGKLKLNEKEFNENWKSDSPKGIAILSAPKDEFFKCDFNRPDNKHFLTKLFLSIFSKHKKRFISVIFLTLLILFAEICLPLLFQKTIDDGINGKDISLVWLLIIGQFFIFIGNYVSTNLVELILAKLGIDISVSLLSGYLKKLAFLPVSFFDKKMGSDLVQKIDDHNRIKNFLVQFPQNLFITTLSLLVFSSLLIYESYTIFIIFIIFTCISIAWTLAFMRSRKSIDYTLNAYAAENRNNLHELIYGMTEIKANNAQNARISTWQRIQDKVNSLSYKYLYVSILQKSGNVFFSRIKEILITGICAVSVINGDMTIGVMMVISYIIGCLSSPFSNIIKAINDIQEVSISSTRIEEIENYSVKDNTSLNCCSDIKLEDIVFNNVSFKYPGSENYVIENIYLKIPIGKITAFVGESGCGKSTLVRTILKFYDPSDGNIMIGKKHFSEIDNENWISLCGVVMQNGYVFSGSIIDNIALNTKNPDMDRIKAAVRIANLESFINSLPMGYNTNIGSIGLELSGGQQQRLMIARAIYKDPEILILDEATSSLDANNEAIILNNIKKLWSGRTIIIVAHRLSTIIDADQIVFMKDGHVHEIGTHKSLLDSKGGYYSLVQKQMA